jgi:hypothetical protein
VPKRFKLKYHNPEPAIRSTKESGDQSEEKLIENQEQNKKHRVSLYAQALKEAEKLDFETADNVDGIDDEIKLLRVKIKTMLMNDPENVKLIMQAANMVARLVKERYNMDKGQKKGLKNAIKNLIKDVGLPVGVAMINKKLGNE